MEKIENIRFNEADEQLISKENLIAHEAAHALVAHYLGLGVAWIKVDLNNGCGRMLQKKFSEDKHEEAILSAAGFAGELFIGGETNLRERNFRGLGGDSRRVNNLGYITQDAKAALVNECFSILNAHKEEYLSLCKFISDRCNEYPKGGKTLPIHIMGYEMPLPAVN